MSAAIALGVGQRTADWLKRVWPVDTAKHLAREFDFDLRTAEGYCAGNLPSNRAWHAMVVRWGKAFIAFVYAPNFDWAEQARLEVEIETIQARLDAVARKIRSRDATAPQNDGGEHSAMGRPVAGDDGRMVGRAGGKAGEE